MSEYSKKYQAEFDAIFNETSAALSRMGKDRSGSSRLLDGDGANKSIRSGFGGWVKGILSSNTRDKSARLPRRGGLVSPARSPRSDGMLANRSVQGRLDARVQRYRNSSNARSDLKRRVRQIFAERKAAYGGNGFVEVNKKAVALPADCGMDQLEAAVKARERAKRGEEVRERARAIEKERQREREVRVASRADRVGPSRPSSGLARPSGEGGGAGAFARGGVARPPRR